MVDRLFDDEKKLSCVFLIWLLRINNDVVIIVSRIVRHSTFWLTRKQHPASAIAETSVAKERGSPAFH